jgi:hypothetical protein
MKHIHIILVAGSVVVAGCSTGGEEPSSSEFAPQPAKFDHVAVISNALGRCSVHSVRLPFTRTPPIIISKSILDSEAYREAKSESFPHPGVWHEPLDPPQNADDTSYMPWPRALHAEELPCPKCRRAFQSWLEQNRNGELPNKNMEPDKQ